MKTIGFLISQKNGETRRAILPKDAANLRLKDQFFLEKGYGESIGFSDEEYSRHGVHMVSREAVFQCDILCDVKIGDASFVPSLTPEKILFGWAHAAQKTSFTDAAIKGKHTVIAWEEMDEGNRNIFYRNREIAGEAAVLHGFSCYGRMPYTCKAAILGRGNTAKGALRILNGLGASVDVFGRKSEDLFREKLGEYDVVINCVFWDLNRKKRLLEKSDLARMKKGSMLIDVSCDGDLAIETGRPTTIADPVYTACGILHYAVDNTPSLYGRTASEEISGKVCEMAELLLEGKSHPLLQKATVIQSGEIISPAVKKFREEQGLHWK